MKILFIDHISPQGHVVFNQIHINALLSLGYEVYCVFRQGYYEKIIDGIDGIDGKNNNIHLILELPNSLYKKRTNGFMSRLDYLIQLLLIRKKIKFSVYDAVILSAYEPISMFLANIKHSMFLINHNNISGLDSSKIKEYFTQKLAKRNIHIVLDNNIQQRLEKSEIFNAEIVPHGYNSPFAKGVDNACFASLFNIDKRIGQNDYSIFFCPSSTSVDKDFISTIIADEEFNRFLTKNNILFLIKGNYTCGSLFNENIVIINRYLNDAEYQQLFTMSKAIVIPYGTNFKYRISGIMFECFSNNIPCLVSNIESMREYSNYFDYYPYFCDISELQSQMLYVKNELNRADSYLTLEELNPTIYWSSILDEKYKQCLNIIGK